MYLQKAISTRCNFGSPNQGSGSVVPVIAVGSAAQGEITMEVWNYSTSVSLTIAYDGVMLTYLGASNSTGNYLLKVFLIRHCFGINNSLSFIVMLVVLLVAFAL